MLLSRVFHYVAIVLSLFFSNSHFGQCVWDGEWEGVSGQFQTSFRPLSGLALGYLSFKYGIACWSPKMGVLEIKNLQGELRERKLIAPKENAAQ